MKVVGCYIGCKCDVGMYDCIIMFCFGGLSIVKMVKLVGCSLS